MKRNPAEISPSTTQAIRRLGENVRLARRRRRERQSDVAARMGVSVNTLAALGSGKPGVSLGTLATALLCLGLLDRLERVADPGEDDIALLVEGESLPKRIHPKRSIV